MEIVAEVANVEDLKRLTELRFENSINFDIKGTKRSVKM